MTARRPSKIQPTARDRAVKIITTGLQEIPLPGTTTLATFIEEKYADHLKRTIADFRDALLDHAQNIDQLRCNEQRLFALLNTVSIEVLKTASQAKRGLFRDIVLNYAKGKPADEHFVEACVQTITEATELQLRLLALGMEVELTHGEFPEKYSKLNGLFPDIPEDLVLTAYLGILERGLVRRPFRGTPRRSEDLTLWHLVLTPFARQMLAWIRQ